MSFDPSVRWVVITLSGSDNRHPHQLCLRVRSVSIQNPYGLEPEGGLVVLRFAGHIDLLPEGF